ESKALIHSFGCCCGRNSLNALSEEMIAWDAFMTLFGTLASSGSSQPHLYAGTEWPGLLAQIAFWFSLESRIWIICFAASGFFEPVKSWALNQPGPAVMFASFLPTAIDGWEASHVSLAMSGFWTIPVANSVPALLVN